VDIFFEIKKILKKLKKIKQKIKQKIKKIKKKQKKPGADTWHVLFKNVNYLNTFSEKDQIDHNLTKMRT